MEFHKKRRQQFLSEKHYSEDMVEFVAGIARFESSPAGSGKNEAEGWVISSRMVAMLRFDRLVMRYTAGEPLKPLREELEQAVAAYEHYTKVMREYEGDVNEPGFVFGSIDDYSRLMQLIGLCYLLHRPDLLPRIAAIQDGEEQTNGGADWLVEELLSYAPLERYESDHLCASKPYEALADALSSTDNDAALKDLNRFLKRWYKDLAGCGWHDSHKPDANGNQGGYYGYWSFEAGAAVLLLGIEDDSCLHQYLYYPKDLVQFAREFDPANDPLNASPTADRLRREAGQPCPQAGWWWTPAQIGSRRHFQQGEIMPSVGGDYGQTIWQWDDNQG